MKRVRVWIDGVTPLMQDRFTGEPRGRLRRNGPEPGHDEAEKRAIAERACYREPEGGLYLPGAALLGMLRDAGRAHYLPGTCHTASDAVPLAVVILDDRIPLYTMGHVARLADFAIDARGVVDEHTGRRVMRYRPRLDNWSACMDIGVHADVLAESVVNKLVTEGGERVGLGAFRPACGGSFGRFVVASWEARSADVPRPARTDRGERAGETR
jgi:hypothetical protein